MITTEERPKIDYKRELWLRMNSRQYDATPNSIRVSRFTFGQIAWAYRMMRRDGIDAWTARRLVMQIAWAAGMEGIVFKGENYTDDMLIWFKPSQNPAHLETVKARP